jgi:hypothetical protein
VTIRIFNTKGQIVYVSNQKDLASQMICLNFEKPTAGLYWVEIQSEKSTIRRRLVID